MLDSFRPTCSVEHSSPMKANFYNPARSVALRRVRGLIPPVSSSKGGAVLLGAMGMIIDEFGLYNKRMRSKRLILPPGDLRGIFRVDDQRERIKYVPHTRPSKTRTR